MKKTNKKNWGYFIMVRIKLTLRELNLLLGCYKGVNDSSCIIIDFDEKEIDNVINSISDYFIKKGLQKNCEPNCLGIELENLNDKFISVLQKINK